MSFQFWRYVCKRCCVVTVDAYTCCYNDPLLWKLIWLMLTVLVLYRYCNCCVAYIAWWYGRAGPPVNLRNDLVIYLPNCRRSNELEIERMNFVFVFGSFSWFFFVMCFLLFSSFFSHCFNSGAPSCECVVTNRRTLIFVD